LLQIKWHSKRQGNPLYQQFLECLLLQLLLLVRRQHLILKRALLYQQYLLYHQYLLFLRYLWRRQYLWQMVARDNLFQSQHSHLFRLRHHRLFLECLYQRLIRRPVKQRLPSPLFSSHKQISWVQHRQRFRHLIPSGHRLLLNLMAKTNSQRLLTSFHKL